MEIFRSYEHRRRSKQEAFLFAFIILAAGILLLMRNLGYLTGQTSNIIFSWPMLIIAVGILNLKKHVYGFGLLIILLGGFFIITRYYQFPISFSDVFLPTLIILFGAGLLYASLRIFRNRNWTISKSGEDRLVEVAILGGGIKSYQFKDFKGGKIVSIFGGSKLDFRQSTLAEGTSELAFVSVFGGCELILPAEWHVKTEVVSILGTVIDRRPPTKPGTDKTLVVKGIAVFGGGEIKSH